MEFAIGGLAAAGAGIFTNPIQVSKAHLKVSKELAAKGQRSVPYKNVFHAGYLVAKKEGALALQKGLTSSLWMHLIKYGVKLGMLAFVFLNCEKRVVYVWRKNRWFKLYYNHIKHTIAEFIFLLDLWHLFPSNVKNAWCIMRRKKLMI